MGGHELFGFDESIPTHIQRQQIEWVLFSQSWGEALNLGSLSLLAKRSVHGNRLILAESMRCL